jgi:hypothetical protein
MPAGMPLDMVIPLLLLDVWAPETEERPRPRSSGLVGEDLRARVRGLAERESGRGS